MKNTVIIILLIIMAVGSIGANVFLTCNRVAIQNDFSGEITTIAEGKYQEYIDPYGRIKREIEGISIPERMYIVPSEGTDAGKTVELKLRIREEYRVYEKSYINRKSYFIEYLGRK